MKTTVFLTAVLILIASISFAQRSDNQREYNDVDDVKTVSGEFSSTVRPDAKFKTDDGTEYIVKLGPYWYWEQNDYEVSTNTQTNIKGEVKQVDGQYELYPWTIDQSGNSMYFADDNGVPKWSKGKGKRGNRNRKGNRGNRGNRGNCPRIKN